MQGRRTLRQTSIALSLAVVLAFAAAGCGGDDDDQPTGAGTEDAGIPATADELRATTWQLTSYADNKTGDLTAASETSVGTAKFDATTVAGSTGCNQYSGPYTLGADGAISFGPTATTRMACNADLTAQEQGFLAGLTAARQAVLADKALQLLNDKHDTILLFSPPKGAVLESATWNVINYRTPNAVTSSILGADITMQFAGGHITGNSGCNDFTASYTSGSASSGDLAITDFQRGNAVCTTPPGVAEQEQAFAEAFVSAVGYEIVGNRLTLLDNQGRDAVQFELAEESRGPLSPMLSPRTRWLVIAVVGIALGVAVTLGIWAVTGSGDGSSPSNTSRRVGVPLRSGAPIDPDALWLFGFDTVRTDATTLDDARQLSASVFGAPAARGDRVYFYDAGSGQVGRLDAATSTFKSAAPLTPWNPPADRSEVAATADAVWAVIGPARVARVDPETLTLTADMTLSIPNATESWIDATDDMAMVATFADGRVVLTPLGAEPVPAPLTVQPDASRGMVTDLALGDDRTWIVQERGATAVQGNRVIATVPLPDDAGTERAAAGAGDDLWVLADDGAALYRLRADAPDDVERVAVLATPPETFRAPVDLVADRDAVWALIPTRSEPDRHDAVVVRVDTEANAVTGSLRLPSSLFAGGLARTR